jgi:SAM-dependent methyltransferase
MKEPGIAYETMMKPVISHNDKMIPFYSTARDGVILDPTVLDTSYWRENLQSTVLFSGAVQRLLQEARLPTVFVEIGPHSTLSSPLRQILRKHDADQASKYIPTLVRGQPQWKALLMTAGRLHSTGASVDLDVVNNTEGAHILTELPTYPWLHEESFFSETRLVREWRNPKEPHHELLGPRSLESTDLEPSWRRVLFVGHVPWLWDHMLGKDLIFPCAGYIAMAGEAIRQTAGTEDYTIHNLTMKTPLVLKESEAAELVTSLRPARLTMTTDSPWYEFTISAYQNGTWKKHCTGKVRAGTVKKHAPHDLNSYPRMVSSKSWYEAMKKRGLNFGPEFRRLENISANPSSPQASARVQYSDESDTKHSSIYAIHPTIIDQNLQMLGVAMCRGSSRHMTKLCMPVAIESIYIAPGRGMMFIDASCNPTGDSIVGNAVMVSEDIVVLSMEGGMLFGVEDSGDAEQYDSLVARINWKPHVNLVSLTDEIVPTMLNNRATYLLNAVFGSIITATANNIRSLHPGTPQLEEYQRWVCSQADARNKTEMSESSLCQDDHLAEITKEIEVDHTDLVPLLRLARKVSMASGGLVKGEVSPEEVGNMPESLFSVYKAISLTAGCAEFFSLLGHSNPMMRVLTIGLGNGFAVTQALRGLTSKNGTPMYSKWIVTDRTEDRICRAKETLSWASRIECTLLDIAQDPIEQGFEAESCDLIIASEAFDADMPVSPSLRNIFTLLAPGGRLFYQGVYSTIPLVTYMMGIFPEWWAQRDPSCSKPSITSEQWENELKENGFDMSDMLALKDSSVYHAGTMIASRPYPLINNHSKEIAILYPSTVPDWARTLAKGLERRGQLVTWVPFGESPPPGIDLISVMDLEGPFFDDISAERFAQFQQLVSQIKSSHVVWITGSSQMSCSDSRFGLTLGVIRTIRHEVTPEFYTLEIDEFDDSSAGATVRILEHINQQRDCSTVDPDREFALEQGRLHVSRAHWISARQELSTTRRADCEAKFLDIGSYGLLSTLAWSEREHCEMQNDEVEIDMKYIGLNFRVSILTQRRLRLRNLLANFFISRT